MTRPMPCAYCDRDATVRPVRYEAVCWWCWWKMYGEETAVRKLEAPSLVAEADTMTRPTGRRERGEGA